MWSRRITTGCPLKTNPIDAPRHLRANRRQGEAGTERSWFARPEQPQGVEATVSAPGWLRLSWELAARASRYKVRAQVVGRDQDFETVTEVFEERAELTFEPAQTVRI